MNLNLSAGHHVTAPGDHPPEHQIPIQAGPEGTLSKY